MGAHLMLNQILTIAQANGNIADVEQKHGRQHGA